MVSDGAGGLVETKVKFPVWFDPVAEDGTPMREAIELARNILRLWIVEHRRSYPPIVINITDGEPNDDPTEAARKLTALETEDGACCSITFIFLSLQLLRCFSRDLFRASR